MITLITGLPGAGKTLYAVDFVRKLEEKEKRTVYYHGIKELALGWIPLEKPEDWFLVPAGSIVVLDECQRAFRQQALGQKVPQHVEELETHRHSGIDLFILTQHPMQIDNKVRRLVGSHRHVVRAFGTKRATVHKWSEVRESCDKNRSDSIREQFPYPVDVFKLYKSAEVHTHKASIPFRVILLGILPFLVVYCVWSFYRWRENNISSSSSAVAKNGFSGGLSGASGVPLASESGSSQPRVSAVQFIDLHRARIPGLAYTAPFYDDVTKPVRAPYPAACVLHKIRDDCTCYTNQGTRLDVGKEVCKTILTNGFFRYWEDERERDDRVQKSKPEPGGAATPYRRPAPAWSFCCRNNATGYENNLFLALSITDLPCRARFAR